MSDIRETEANQQRDHRQQVAREICAVLRSRGHRALFAGGCVRDRLLGIPSADIDIATSAMPEEISALFRRTIQVGARYGVVVVVQHGEPYEVATFRKDGPYLDGRHPTEVAFTGEVEDAQRRDFTINALFLEPESGDILDYVGGETDLRNGVIRAVGDPRLRFREDRLRMLRAVRFAARFDYGIEENTLSAIRQEAGQIHETSAERIRDELLKMLTGGRARRAFELLDETGLLGEVLPEIAAMKGVEQPDNYHPEGDVFNHTLLALSLLSPEASDTLALGVLLHDVGKPRTQTFEDRIRFNFHEKCGARMSEEICRRLRLSNDDTERVAWLVENHMRLQAFSDMREHRRKRLARMDAFPELVELCRLDCLASHQDLSIIQEIEAYLDELGNEALAPPPLVTGKDLIRLGYKPGPLFRTILEDVESRQLDGILSDSAAALAYVKERYPGFSG